MPAFVDITCTRCGRRYGYLGEPASPPPCTHCGYVPPVSSADVAAVEDFKRQLVRLADEKTVKMAMARATAPNVSGHKLQRLRLDACLTFGQVARGSGIAVERIAAFEGDRVKPTPEELLRIMQVFQLPSPAQIIHEEPAAPVPNPDEAPS